VGGLFGGVVVVVVLGVVGDGGVGFEDVDVGGHWLGGWLV